MKTLSELYKKPLASFFLSKPKPERPLPKDYRFLPDRTDKFDKKTIFAIRRSRSLQSIGSELSLNIRYESSTKMKKAKLTDNPEIFAVEYRTLFDLSPEKQQKKFRNPYEMFGYLRDVLEDVNILTFQFP
ncbi:MAG: hypothetical protein QXU18_16260, partial [Thermoplasmatales archaeon]